MGRHRVIALAMVGFLVLAACSDSDDSATTTTDGADSTTTTGSGEGATTTTAANGPGTTVAGVAGGDTSSTSTTAGALIPEYSIQARIAGEAGDTVVVFVEPATYSDLDIENVVADAVQRFAPITTLHVIDDVAIVDLVLSDESALTAEELADRDAHYFARLEEGFRLVFEGPFDTVPDAILGS